VAMITGASKRRAMRSARSSTSGVFDALRAGPHDHGDGLTISGATSC
jgi:hypothetical protein